MTTKTDTEQERAEFEAWYATHDPRTPQSPFDRKLAWEAYQAGRDAQQSQKPEPDVTGLVEARCETMRFALSEMVKWYENTSLGNNPAFQYYDLAKKALLSAALQSQPTEAFPCRIVEADFETDTVTLEMQGKYTVSSGQKYLCDVPLYRCPDFSCKGKLDGSNHIADMRKKVKENHIPDASKMVVPDGWQLVPIEPTDSMLASARYARQRDQADRSSTIYRAMLAAAPKYTGDSNE